VGLGFVCPAYATPGGDLKDRCLNWRPQRGRHPFHRMGLGDHLIDVIAIDALKHAPLVPDTRRLDVCQDHWPRTFGTGMGPNCYSAWIKQDCQG
jgi:hypothetical protein